MNSITHTRSYILVTAKAIRQVPGTMLNDNFISSLLQSLEMQGFELVGEGFRGRLDLDIVRRALRVKVYSGIKGRGNGGRRRRHKRPSDGHGSQLMNGLGLTD